MSEDLLDSLNRIIETEPVIILDTCALETRNEYGDCGAFLEKIYDMRDLRSIPLSILEQENDLTIRVQQLVENQPRIQITQQVYDEIERKVSKVQQALQHKTTGRHRRVDPYEKHDDLQLTQLPAEIGQNLFALLKHLRTKILRLNEVPEYDTLFKFFKELRELDPQLRLKNKQKLQNTKNPYFFGDESIAAAVYYRVLTGQTPSTTAVATTDHDIKKLVRTAHILFETIDQKKFHEKTATHPFRIYLPETHRATPVYRPYLDTKLSQSMGNITTLEQLLGTPPVNQALELAYDAFQRIC